MHTTGWSRGLEVSGGGQGVVSHAGLVLLRHLADTTGLTGGLSRALVTPRFLVHDRGQVMANLARRTGSEGRISTLKRQYGWDRSRLDGTEGARIWARHGVLAHNLVKVSALAS
jgi:hypothetical protein